MPDFGFHLDGGGLYRRSFPLLRVGVLVLPLAMGGCSSLAIEAEEGSGPPGLAGTLRGILGQDLGEVRYFAAEVDLNDDGKQEIVAHVAGPMVCGTGGCSTLVLERDAEDLRLVTRIFVTRPPIIADATKTHGWRDLVARVSGGGILPGYDARLRYDGRSYPENPTVAPAEPVSEPVGGTVLIPPFQSFREGQLLSPGTP
jgi:hypothetical protein